MRTHIRCSMLIAVLGVVPLAQAQQQFVVYDGPPHNLIDINPLSLLFGKLSLEYEHSMGPGASFLVGPQIQFFDPPALNGPSDGTSVQAYGLTLGLHFFPNYSAPAGFWLGPELQLDWATGSLNGDSAQGPDVAINGIIGYTFIPAPHLAISLGIGAGAVITSVASSDSTLVVVRQGFDLTGRAAIGYAW
jgi:hypothetical protein